jgi:hypothetical protein
VNHVKRPAEAASRPDSCRGAALGGRVNSEPREPEANTVSIPSGTNTTTTTNTSNANTTEPRPLQFGQTFSPNGLIYTTTDSTGEGWFCDSGRRHAPLEELPKHHPIHLNDLQPNLLQLGRVRWSPPSIERFVQGEEANAHETLLGVRNHLSTYFVASEDVLSILAVFVLLTYVFTAAETVPYLHLLGEPATGKTLLADLLEGLCFNARQAATISAAAVYRLLHATTGTLIIDEQGAGDRTWRNVLRAGYRRSGAVAICEGDTTVERRCFGPKVLLTNDALDDAALSSRCITITLTPTTQRAKRYSTFAVSEREMELRDRLHQFGLGYGLTIWSRYMNLPDVPGLAHREADLAAPLLAVAQVVGAAAPGHSDLSERILSLLQLNAARRMENQRVDGERGALARAIIRFVTPGSDTPHQSYTWGGHCDWYLASEFAAFLNRSGELSRPMSPREVGERLSRFELVLARHVIDVPPKRGPLDRHAPRVQRVAYRFDLTKVQQWTGRIP